MSDFDIFLEAVLNERFIDESTQYYNDPYNSEQIEDTEAGLAGEFSEDDIRHVNRDPEPEHAAPFKCF